MWLLLSLISTASANTCTGETHVEQVAAHVEDSMLAFATLDEDGFREAAGEAYSALPCVAEVMTPARAAAFHRMMGLHAFLNGDRTGAEASFAAALAIEPDFKLSTKVAPEGGRLARLYTGAADAAHPAPTAFQAPSSPKPYTNGEPGNQRVATWPVIAQLGSEGFASWTGYYGPGDKVKIYGDTAPLPDAPPAEQPAAVATAPVEEPPAQVEDVVAVEDVVEDAVEDVVEDVVAVDEPVEVVRDEIVQLDEPVAVAPVTQPRPAPVEATPLPKSAPVGSTPVGVKKDSGRAGKLVAAGIAAGGAGALYGASALARTSFDASPSQAKYYAVNGTYVGSVVVGVAALGLTVDAAF